MEDVIFKARIKGFTNHRSYFPSSARDLSNIFERECTIFNPSCSNRNDSKTMQNRHNKAK